MSNFITSGELRMEAERLCDENERLEAENAKLREQVEQLVTLLRVDCDIDASWDGLRRFWSIGLTEDGCLMRDRACKAEAENAKLREQVERLRTQLADMTESVGRVEERCAKTFEVGKRWMAKAARFEAENAKLRELVQDYEHCSMHADCGRCEYDGTTSTHCPLSPCFPDIDELSELGVDA